MDDLRSEIRVAFEKEQAANPPAPGLRPSVVASVARQPRRAPNLEWLAVAAAILLGVLVVAGLMSQRLAHPAMTPVGAPKASPVVDYGPPPAGVPLLYVHDPNHPTWLIGYDWTGKPRATVKLGDAQPEIGMAPDGQSFAIGLGAKGGNWQFLDRLGQPVATPSTLPGAYSTHWADDNQHVCSMTFDQQALDYTLWTALPGQPIKRVTVVAHDPNVGQTVVSLAACSFKNDLAIAVRTTIANPSEMWVVRLSDGKVLSHNAFADSLSNVVASSDGALVAENSSQSTGQLPQGAASTIIRRVSDRSVVATLAPTIAVLDFSGDDSLMLVSLTPMVGGQASHLAVMDSRGQTVWTDDGTAAFGGSVALPGGRDFALIYASPGAQTIQPATVIIVHGDGSVTKFPGNYETAW